MKVLQVLQDQMEHQVLPEHLVVQEKVAHQVLQEHRDSGHQERRNTGTSGSGTVDIWFFRNIRYFRRNRYKWFIRYLRYTGIKWFFRTSGTHRYIRYHQVHQDLQVQMDKRFFRYKWLQVHHGSSGETGTSGSSGTSGINGTSGSSGTSGEQGTSGSQVLRYSGNFRFFRYFGYGTDGSSGTSGTSGTNGFVEGATAYGEIFEVAGSAISIGTSFQGWNTGAQGRSLSVNFYCRKQEQQQIYIQYLKQN